MMGSTQWAMMAVAGLMIVRAGAANASCPFDPQTMAFTGEPIEQAKCLLRPFPPGKGDADPHNLSRIPAPLDRLIGQKVALSRERLCVYLKQRKISQADIGGSLTSPVSRSYTNSPDKPPARYFVIHDTSVPSCGRGCDGPDGFPTGMNDPSFAFNGPQLVIREKTTNDPKAHVYVARTGESATAWDFVTPWRATRHEGRGGSTAARGLFLHVENVQPRKSPPGRTGDGEAPEHGFTQLQYERLALIYVAASLRRGEWLIPAFHGAIDEGVGDHDDPRNFKLQDWADAIAAIIAAVGSD